MHNSVLEDDRVDDAHTICYLGMCSDRDIGADLGPRVYLRRRMYADQSDDLLLLHAHGMRQYVFVNSLIIFEVDLLHLQQLLRFLDLLPEMLGRVHYVQECRPSALAYQWVDEVFHFDLFGTIFDFELARKLIKAKKK
jgi:hypothetical protein